MFFSQQTMTFNSHIHFLLDNLVKKSAKENKAKKAKATTAGKKVKKGAAKATTATAAVAPKKGKKAKKTTTAENKSNKMAVVAVSAKAKRDAKVAAKRGMATTSVVSAKELKATIQKEALKLAKQLIGGAKGAGPARPKKGLKISFRPSELNRTTNKQTSLQIGAILAKAPKGNRNQQVVRQPGASRKVIFK
jgi:hypothetical protein